MSIEIVRGKKEKEKEKERETYKSSHTPINSQSSFTYTQIINDVKLM